MREVKRKRNCSRCGIEWWAPMRRTSRGFWAPTYRCPACDRGLALQSRAGLLRGEFTDRQRAAWLAKTEHPYGLGCWAWTAYTHKSARGNRPRWNCGLPAARIGWLMAHQGEEWSDDIEGAHLCQNSECVNPTHIEPMTKAEHKAYDSEPRRFCECPLCVTLGDSPDS